MPRHLLSTDGLGAFEEFDLDADPVAIADEGTVLTDDGGVYKRGTLPARTVSPVASSVHIDAIPEPWTLAHRGIPNLMPENTMESFRAAVAAGAKVIETDVFLLRDGTLGVMHDPTIDRTTTGSGNTADQTIATWAALVDDHGAALGGAWTNAHLTIPTLTQLLDELGGRVAFVLEAKNAGGADAMVSLLDDLYPHLKPTIIIASFDLDELSGPVAAGYAAAFYADDTSVSASTVAAAGVGYAGLIFSGLNTTYLSQLVDQGIKCWSRPSTEDRYTRQVWMDAGCVGHISDDCLYAAGSNGHRLTSDPFDLGTWYHGHIGAIQASRRGTLTGGKLKLTASTTTSVLQGWASPLASPSAFTITLTYTLETAGSDSTRWAGIALLTEDRGFDPFAGHAANDGYHLLIRQDGRLDIYRVDNGSSTLLQSTAGTALTTGTSFTVTITVDASSITMARSDTSEQVTAADATYRGAFLHLTNSGVGGHQCSFANLSVA